MVQASMCILADQGLMLMLYILLSSDNAIYWSDTGKKNNNCSYTNNSLLKKNLRRHLNIHVPLSKKFKLCPLGKLYCVCGSVYAYYSYMLCCYQKFRLYDDYQDIMPVAELSKCPSYLQSNAQNMIQLAHLKSFSECWISNMGLHTVLFRCICIIY